MFYTNINGRKKNFKKCRKNVLKVSNSIPNKISETRILSIRKFLLFLVSSTRVLRISEMQFVTDAQFLNATCTCS